MLQKALGASRVEQGGPSILLFIFFLKHNTKKLGPRRLPASIGLAKTQESRSIHTTTSSL